MYKSDTNVIPFVRRRPLSCLMSSFACPFAGPSLPSDCHSKQTSRRHVEAASVESTGLAANQIDYPSGIFRHTPEVMLLACILSKQFRSLHTDFHEIIHNPLQVSVDTAAREKANSAVLDGSLCTPRHNSIMTAGAKLNWVDLMYRRHLRTSYSFARQQSGESSK